MMGGDSSKQASDTVQWPPEGNKLPVATFAGGCFWGVELAFQREAGVEYSCVGYAQGEVPNPSYEAVCTGTTGHTEAVQVVYNPEQVSYERLCRLLFERINHRQKNGQGNDRGSQYRAGVYCHSNEQLEVAQHVNKDFEGSVVEVLPISSFYPAEAYHQQYLEKGGRWGRRQCASKGCQDAIRCYG